MAENSPGSTSRFTPRKAGTSTSPVRYTFHKFSALEYRLQDVVPYQIQFNRMQVDFSRESHFHLVEMLAPVAGLQRNLV